MADIADVYTKVGSVMIVTSQTTREVDLKSLMFEKEVLQSRMNILQGELDKINALIVEAEKLGLK